MRDYSRAMVPPMQVRISSQYDDGLRYSLFHRRDPELVESGRLRNAFYTGGNSTCRAHIRRHYELYKMRCEEENIPESRHAIPRPLLKKIEELERNPKVKAQSKLDAMLEKVKRLQAFTREGVLHAVSQFLACNDQV